MWNVRCQKCCAMQLLLWIRQEMSFSFIRIRMQSIRENGDNGTPAALNEDSITGKAFMELARNVVEQTEIRNRIAPPTHIVEVK